ncbi:MAG: GTPase HflX [Candidatus Omnitrophota bacterium]
MEKAILVTADFNKRSSWTARDSAAELKELAGSAGAQVIDEIICRRERISPSYFIGRGKAEEVALAVKEKGAHTVIFNDDLSGSQQKNLEELLGVKTIDRTQLILDIFARRARSNEGKVQVELAQLLYLMPRLVGKGVELSRLGGGIGTRGPGETKLEVDRRSIRDRIARLKEELGRLTMHRKMRSNSRQKIPVPAIAIVGYTNAGKSTLLNALTDSHVVAQDRLFSTLDATVRQLTLPNNQKVLFADTVGFLHDLPHHLIESFKATLEEVVDADILLHVLDSTQPKVGEQSAAVYRVLAELGVKNKPVITVLNKADRCDEAAVASLRKAFEGAIVISALQRQNFGELFDRITQLLSALVEVVEFTVPQARMDILTMVYESGHVISKEYRGQDIVVRAQVPLKLKEHLKKLTRMSA